MLANPDVVIGLGDAGAHVALTMDAGQPSYVLGHWVRDEGCSTSAGRSASSRWRAPSCSAWPAGGGWRRARSPT